MKTKPELELADVERMLGAARAEAHFEVCRYC